MEIVQSNVNAMKIVSANDESLSYIDYKPGANTMLYVPMENDLLDHSGRNISMTNAGVILDNSVANVGVGYFDGSSRINFPSSFFNMSSSNFTISIRCRDGSGNGDTGQMGTSHGSIFNNQWTLYSSILLRYNGTKLYAGTQDKTWNIWSGEVSFDINVNTWVLWTVVREGTSWKVYKNKTLKWSGTKSGNPNYNSSYTGAIGGHEVSNPNYYKGHMSRVIVENRAWTQNDLNDYYDKVKNKYGIS